MIRVNGVNISSMMQKQLRAMGDAATDVKRGLHILGRTRGMKGKKVASSESSKVTHRARVGNVGTVYSFEYGDDGNKIYYYRTGSAIDASAEKLEAVLGKFPRGDAGADVWTLMVGKFDGGSFVEPEHDNTGIDGAVEAEA